MNGGIDLLTTRGRKDIWVESKTNISLMLKVYGEGAQPPRIYNLCYSCWFVSNYTFVLVSVCARGFHAFRSTFHRAQILMDALRMGVIRERYDTQVCNSIASQTLEALLDVATQWKNFTFKH